MIINFCIFNLYPNYEAVNVLRVAKEKKKVDEADYDSLKKAVFQDGKNYREVKNGLTSIIKQREEMEPEEVRKKTRIVVIRRFIANLKAVKAEMKAQKLLPQKLIGQTENLIDKIEACL